VIADIKLDLSRPRDKRDPVLSEYSDKIFSLMA
jgi:hypothetical protein